MANGQSKQHPYRTLGFHLKSLREKENESIPDVSGAVEIESELLVEYEDGLKLPSEDILLLLISHFNLKNEEAMKLWRMAGYDNLTDNGNNSSQELYGQQPAVFILPIDARVVYTDMVQTNINDFGIVLNFQQTNNQQNQPLTVSKVGMSREHAENLAKMLNEVLKNKEVKKIKRNKQAENKNNNQKDKNQWLGSQDS
jgi:predicted transcriptional regulator